MSKLEIVKRVQKLLKLSDGAAAIGSQAEAETAAAVAQRLMLEHRLSMTDIETANFKRNEPIEDVLVSLDEMGYPSKRRQNWVGVMLVGMQDSYFVRVLGSRKPEYHFIGRKSDRENCIEMTRYLLGALREVVTNEINKKLADGTITRRDVRRFKKGFKLGYSSALAKRMRVEREQLEVATGKSNPTAMVHIQKDRAELDDFLNAKYKSLRKSRSLHAGSAEGYSAGRSYGSQIGIGGTKRLVG